MTNADNLITEVNQRLASVGSKVYTNGQQNGSNPFGFGQQGFDFKNSNFNDVFNSGNNQKTETKANVEDVEEV